MVDSNSGYPLVLDLIIVDIAIIANAPEAGFSH